MGMDAINADAQYLGIALLEFRQIFLEVEELYLSSTRKVEYIEAKYNVALP